ncbi:hypothetical protein ILYODFUR_028132 [Ilyodon furcidens]|uniref:NADH dehydrogenase subunit 6 n=1 Tax=Ilyodon furcidens TaxID=33524 RepID=A0ABV0UVX9_9TELE
MWGGRLRAQRLHWGSWPYTKVGFACLLSGSWWVVCAWGLWSAPCPYRCTERCVVLLLPLAWLYRFYLADLDVGGSASRGGVQPHWAGFFPLGMVVGGVVRHGFCMTAWLALVFLVCLSRGGGRELCMCLCWPRACIWVGLPFWAGCGLLTASGLVWDVFCCSTGLVVAAVRCRALGTGRSVGSALWVWACWSCALLCVVYSGCTGLAGLLYFWSGAVFFVNTAMLPAGPLLLGVNGFFGQGTGCRLSGPGAYP